MIELSQRERSLLAMARQGLEPTAEDGERLRAAVTAAPPLGGGPSGGTSGTSAPPDLGVGTGAGWLAGTGAAVVAGRWILGAALLGASFGGGYWLGRQHGESPPAAPIVAPAATASLAPAPAFPQAAPSRSTDAPAAPSVTGSALAAPERSTPASSGPSAGLAAEVALIQAAQRALHAGDLTAALSLVRRLDERFPSGVLREEREAVRVLAQCRRSPGASAAELGRDFERTYPASVYVSRVRAACMAVLPQNGATTN